MNAHLSDKQVLCNAIDRATARLAEVKSRIYPSSIHDIQMQADSAEAYLAHARDVEEIAGDLRVAFIETAACLGNQFMADCDRKAIRNCDIAASEIFADVQSWIDDVRDGE